MKKYFIFAAVAAAGLFASCSSSDDIAANDVGAIENPDARQAIRLNIGNVVDMSTRGTGTVGGVGTGANAWSGQTINVFMFTKGTASTADVYTAVPDGTTLTAGTKYYTTATGDGEFTAVGTETSDGSNYFSKTPGSAGDAYATVLKLTETDASTSTAPVYFYDNLAMYTPGSAANKIPGMDASLASGEAMITDGTINYYPPQGNFDFFGYHGDDAVATTPTITKTDALWTVPFTIDGTQDLMSTKAELTTDQNSTMTGATNHEKDYYSAYAARKGVHPTLTFKHLLTRLQFSVKAGNAAAAGNEGGSAAVPAVHNETDLYTVPAGVIDVANDGDIATQLDGQGAADYTVLQADNKTYYTVTWSGTAVTDKSTGLYTVPASVEVVANDAELDAAQDAADAIGTKVFFVGGTKYVSSEVTQVATPAVPAGQNIANAVKVTSIQVLSENTEGDLAVAWTGAKADYEKITWAATQPDEAARWLTLMERPYAAKKATATAVAAADFTDGATLTTAVTTAEGNVTTAEGNLATAQATLASLDPSDAGYAAAQEAVATAQTAKDAADAALTAAQKALDDLLALEKETISETVYNMLTTAGQDKYDAIDAAEVANKNLIALTPTYPDTDLAQTKKVGESIILSPGVYDATGVAQSGTPLANTAKLRMKVALEQNVPTNWNTPDVRTPKTQEYELEITAPTGGFKQNTSYNIILTVYGLERIEVIAVVEPWDDGGNIEVGQD